MVVPSALAACWSRLVVLAVLAILIASITLLTTVVSLSVLCLTLVVGASLA